MPLPAPAPGLVISYAYLWRHEHEAGREEGAKVRPCAIILVVREDERGDTIVTVAPITSRAPAAPETAVEIPARVKDHLGLDADRCWIVLDDFNQFAWPGYDLHPIPGRRNRFDYGFLPPRLFDRIIRRILELWRQGRGAPTPRT